MQWITYRVLQNVVDNENVFITKKVGYSEANLAIAEAEAYNGEYTVEEDEEIIEKNVVFNDSVSIGGDSTATKDNPKFESHYPIHAYAGIDGCGVLVKSVMSSQTDIANGVNLYSPSVTIPRDGLYLLLASGNFQGSASATAGQRYIAIQKNGSDIASTHYPHTQGGWPTYYLPEIFPLKAGDVVRSYVQQTSGGTRTCVAVFKIVQLSNAIAT